MRTAIRIFFLVVLITLFLLGMDVLLNILIQHHVISMQDGEGIMGVAFFGSVFGGVVGIMEIAD